MRFLIIAASLALLAACATTAPQSEPQQGISQQIRFHPQAALNQGEVTKSATYHLISRDLRPAQYVALINHGSDKIVPIHAQQNIRIELERALETQFASQGLITSPSSENTIVMAIQNALVNVKPSTLGHNISAKVVLEITAETSQGKLVKTYTGTHAQTELLSPSNLDIEQALNGTVDSILQEIAHDAELQQYLQERF